MRRIAAIFALLAPLLAPIVANGETPARIAVAYDIGFLGDNGYNDAVHSGFEAAKLKFDLFEPFVREVPTSGTTLDRLTRLRFLAKSGYTLIIAVGPGYRETVLRAAREYPQVQFAIINERTIAPLNVANINFDEVQLAYLAGAAAALRSQRGRIAMVGSDSELFAKFEAGARAVRGDIKVRQVPFTGDLNGVDSAIGRADVIYSLWDRDAAIYTLVANRKPASWYIARSPDQFFIQNGANTPRVAAVVTKDMRRPMVQLVRLGLSGRSLLDVIDESGIYGRNYSVANGGITISLSSDYNADARAKLTKLISELRTATNQG